MTQHPPGPPSLTAADARAIRAEALKGKRRLTSSVLGMEVVVFWLAIIAAVVISHVSVAAAVPVGVALAFGCVVVAARITRPWAYPAGTVLQVLAVACGVVVPTMFVLGVIFGALWIVAWRMGETAIRKAEEYTTAAGR